MEGTGMARFKVRYHCIVFRPFKNEVMDAVVTAVTNASPLSEQRDDEHNVSLTYLLSFLAMFCA